MFPLSTVLFPNEGTRARSRLLERSDIGCWWRSGLEARCEFGVVLISRGSEVGVEEINRG